MTKYEANKSLQLLHLLYTSPAAWSTSEVGVYPFSCELWQAWELHITATILTPIWHTAEAESAKLICTKALSLTG